MTRSKPLDYVFVLRPMLFFPGWSTLLAGYLIPYNNKIFVDWTVIRSFSYTDLALVLFSFGAAMGACFLLNQLKDIKGDRRNRKLFIVSEGFISQKAASIETGVLLILAGISALVIRFDILLLIILFVLITGYLYNYPPFVLKDRPWGSVLSNAAMGALAFSLGWVLNTPLQSKLLTDLLPYLLLNTALYFHTTLPDIEGDRESGKNTFAVRYGVNRIILISSLLYAGASAAAYFLDDYQALFVLILAFPFFARTAFDRKTGSAVRTTKFSILFISLMVCLKIPLYFIFMLGGFFLTRWYFKSRFNYDYPNFKGA